MCGQNNRQSREKLNQCIWKYIVYAKIIYKFIEKIIYKFIEAKKNAL